MNRQLTYTLGAGLAATAVMGWTIAGNAVHAQGNTRGFVAPAVFQAAGPTAASLQSSLDQYRLALGGNNNGNLAGPLAGGRREINWDGGGSNATSPAPTPFAGFLNTRGALFTTRGSGFVQAPPDGLAVTFGNLTYGNIFQAFSPLRLFSPIASNLTEVQFFVPGGGNVPATTSGFGAIFGDVDQPDGSGPGGKRGNRGASTLIQYYGAAGELLFSSFVPAAPGDGGFSFFGIVFEGARIARVRIIAGDVAPGVDDEPSREVVMMDDFIYGEPRPWQ